MHEDNDSNLIDLGDVVVETKGTAFVGIADPLGGYKQSAGFSTED